MMSSKYMAIFCAVLLLTNGHSEGQPVFPESVEIDGSSLAFNDQEMF